MWISTFNWVVVLTLKYFSTSSTTYWGREGQSYVMHWNTNKGFKFTLLSVDPRRPECICVPSLISLPLYSSHAATHFATAGVGNWLTVTKSLLRLAPRRPPRWHPPAGGSPRPGPCASAGPQSYPESSSGSWWIPIPSGHWQQRQEGTQTFSSYWN